MEHVAKAPSEITLHARNPERSLIFGGNHINFGSVASAPNVSDLDRGRRPGNFADYCDLLRLCQSLNIVHFIAGYPGRARGYSRRRRAISTPITRPSR